jgi:aspartyl/glutamyl-tRNA(Asn/Gln) amidotransferase C subunit
MKSQWTGAIALAASAVAAVALAHTGATGVVLDRMNGMTAMRDTIAELAPMMQGTVPYDTFIVSEGASVIASHAGGTMLSLFPENSLEGVTYAKPEIWSDWQEFAALSEELKAYAHTLSDILAYFDKLQELDTEAVGPTAHVLPIQNVFREDRLQPSLDRDALLLNAPDAEDGCFRVPKIVE